MDTREVEQVSAARTQSLFRDVNERIEESARGGPLFVEFVCECGDRHCSERVSLTLEEYECIRRTPTRFVVCVGHGEQRVERVVERDARYDVVEKFGAGGVAAIRLDPRSRRRFPRRTRRAPLDATATRERP